jgi:hypothetical protein
MTQRFILRRSKESLTFNSSLERGCIMKLKYVSIALAALVASTVPAQAAITIYTTQASYLAAISAPGVDTFNDLNPTTTAAGPLARTAGAYSYTTSVGPTSTLFFPAGTLAGDVWLSSNNRTDTITFNAFSSGVVGLGGFFFGSDATGLFTTPSSITIAATDGSGTVSQTLVNPTVTSFVGFVSTGALTKVDVYIPVQGVGLAGVWPTINNLTLGKAPGVVVPSVPESSTWLMMIAGFGLIGGAMRRRTTARIAQAF